MTDIERPPRDIMPKEFFESWLPSQAGALTAPPTPMTVRVLLDGEGGGTWDLELGPGGLIVDTVATSSGEPEVTVAQSIADWRAIVHGEPGATDLAPPQARPTDVLFLDPIAQKLVRETRGTIRFEVTGFNGRTWSMTVKLGDKKLDVAQPDATITVDAETYALMLARTLPAAAAYFQGKVKIAGDMQLAMQLGMALMPRFG